MTTENQDLTLKKKMEKQLLHPRKAAVLQIILSGLWGVVIEKETLEVKYGRMVKLNISKYEE